MTKIKGKIIVSDPKMFEKFSNVIYRPIKDTDIYTPLELFVKNIRANLSKKKKGGRKYKHNINMARKFRRTRRKRGAGGVETKEQFEARMGGVCGGIQSNIETERREGASLADLEKKFKSDLDWCNKNYFTEGNVQLGGKKSRRKRRRRTKKRKSRRRRKRTRRRKRKKR